MSDFKPDWTLSPKEVVQVALTLGLSKHVPGWPGATDDQLAEVAEVIREILSAHGYWIATRPTKNGN